jgi:xanthine phosphoribosyltransferase
MADKKIYYSWQDIEDMTSDVIQQIAVDGDGFKPDYIVGLTRGGLIPATMISHYFEVPMHTLEIKLRDHAVQPESNKWMAQDALDGKKILIVDDINDTGETLSWIKQDWNNSGKIIKNNKSEINWEDNIRFAVLVENEPSKFGDVDYVSKFINKIDHPQWIVYPWEEWWAI